MAELAPWLRGTDVLSAISAGSNAGLRLRQIGDEEQQQQQNNQLRSEQIQAATALRQAQQGAMTAYRNQQIQDAQTRIKDQEAKQSAADALRKNIGDSTMAFSKAVNSGTDPEQAYEDNPGADPKFVHPILAQSYKDKKDAKKPAKPVTLSGPVNPGSPNSIRVNDMAIDDPHVNSIWGTNAPPGTGTNYVNAAAALTPRPAQQSPFSNPQFAAAYANSGSDVADNGTPLPAQSPYKVPSDVKSAVKSGALTKDAAKKILQDQFGYSE